MRLPFGLNWTYSLFLLAFLSIQPVFGYEKSASVGVSTGFYDVKDNQNADENHNYYSYFLEYKVDNYLLKGQMHHSSHGDFQRYFGLEAGYQYEFNDIYSVYPILGVDLLIVESTASWDWDFQCQYQITSIFLLKTSSVARTLWRLLC